MPAYITISEYKKLKSQDDDEHRNDEVCACHRLIIRLGRLHFMEDCYIGHQSGPCISVTMCPCSTLGSQGWICTHDNAAIVYGGNMGLSVLLVCIPQYTCTVTISQCLFIGLETNETPAAAQLESQSPIAVYEI